jgi:hypothetical protein
VVVADIGVAVEVFGDRNVFLQKIPLRLLRSIANRSARTVLRFFVLTAIMTMGFLLIMRHSRVFKSFIADQPPLGAHVIRYFPARVASRRHASATLVVPLPNSNGVAGRISLMAFS